MRVAGFAMLEVLVALLVLALGVLGTAALQGAALRARHEAQLLATAQALAQSHAERMRANVGQLQLPDHPYLHLQYDSALDGAAPAGPACYGASAHCDGATLAAFDNMELAQRVRASLPGGRVLVCRDSGASMPLEWACQSGSAAPLVIKIGWRARLRQRLDVAGAPAPALPMVALAVDGGQP